MGVRSADGQGAALQMSDGDLQHFLVGTVVNGQGHVDLGDVDVAHDPGTGDVQDLVVALHLLVRDFEMVAHVGQILIIGSGFFPHLFDPLRVLMADLVHVAGDGLGLMHGIPPVTEARIRDETDACQKDQHHEHRQKMTFSLALLFLCHFVSFS